MWRQILIFLCYVAATLCLGALTVIGYCLTALYRELPEEDGAWNCWAYAVPKWLVDPVDTALLVTKSEHAPVPHCRYIPFFDGLYAEEAVPARPHRGLKGILDSFKFKAKIRKGRL
jgi:hypothetical protein